MLRPRGLLAAASSAGAALLLLGALRPAPAQEREPRITATWQAEPIGEVLLSVAGTAGRSIVMGAGVTGLVTATIDDQPWHVVLRTIAGSHGLVVAEDHPGILRVTPAETLQGRESSEAVLTRAYRIRYTPALEMQATLAPLLSSRGAISVAESTNTVVVSDVPRIHDVIARLLR